MEIKASAKFYKYYENQREKISGFSPFNCREQAGQCNSFTERKFISCPTCSSASRRNVLLLRCGAIYGMLTVNVLEGALRFPEASTLST